MTCQHRGWWIPLFSGIVLTFISGGLAWHAHLTESQSRKEQRLIRHLMDMSSDGISIADLKTGMAIYRNPALEKFMGWSSEALNSAGGVHSYYVDQTQWQQIVETIRRGSVFDSNVRLRRPDGEEFTAHLYAVGVHDDCEALVGVFSHLSHCHTRADSKKLRAP